MMSRFGHYFVRNWLSNLHMFKMIACGCLVHLRAATTDWVSFFLIPSDDNDFFFSGNNWGNCPNGTGAVGCGPQEEFRACADVKIVGKGAEEPMVSEDPTTYPITTTSTTSAPTSTPEIPTSEESFSPITTFIISIMSFLVVCLIFSLLYFHFYQVGRQIRNWITGPPKEKNTFQTHKLPNLPPQAPPRMKRSRSPDIFCYDIRRDSLAWI